MAGATGAFFSDTETSTGNTFAAGAIDLGIDNTSYYNGAPSPSTSWGLNFDLDTLCTFDADGPGDNNPPIEHPCLFFDFDDLKPGDFGEDTISIHVNTNESWLCADVKLTSNDDVSCTEPENDLLNGENGACNELGVDLNPNTPDEDLTDGDLAQNIEFLWWADDGDNVLEEDESPLNPSGALGALGVGNTATVALADDDLNIFPLSLQGPDGGLLTDSPEEIAYVGKAWCFGDIAPFPTAIDDSVGNSPADPTNDGDASAPATPEDGGYTCSGASSLNNAAQTDSAKLDISFRAVQTRHNATFQCVNPNQT